MIPPLVASTLVVHCSDHRFLPACEELVEKRLGISDYDLIAVPGGPQFLAALDYLPKFAWAGNRWLKFLIEGHGLKRVVLIGHEDCGWYRHLHGTHAEPEAKQVADLRHAREQVERTLGGIAVESWFVKLSGSQPSFEPIDAGMAHG